MAHHTDLSGPLPLDPEYKKRLFTSNMNKKLVDFNPFKWRPFTVQHIRSKGWTIGSGSHIFPYMVWLDARFGPGGIKGYCKPQFLLLAFMHWNAVYYVWRYCTAGQYKFNSEFH